MNTTMYNYFKSTQQGRDFVVCNPQTGECFAGHFSGGDSSVATLTTELEGLERAGQQSVTVEDENTVTVHW